MDNHLLCATCVKGKLLIHQTLAQVHIRKEDKNTEKQRLEAQHLGIIYFVLHHQ